MNERLIEKIREIFGFTDEGMDLFNVAIQQEFTEEEENGIIEALELFRQGQINNHVLDLINTARNVSDLNDAINKVLDDLEIEIEKATDPIYKKSLEIYADMLYQKFEKHSK